MNKYKVIGILKTFSKDEVKRFRDFLNSPYFNKSYKLAKFYDSLIKFHPEFKSKFLYEEKLLKKVSPHLQYNKSTLLNLFSDLYDAASEFLMYVGIHKNHVESKDFLIDEMIERNLFKSAEGNINKLNTILNDVNNFNSDCFISKYKLSTGLINCHIINKNKSKGSSIAYHTDMLTERGMYITNLFAKELLRTYDNLLTLGKTYKINEGSNFIFKLFEVVDFEKLLRLLISESTNKSYSKIFEIYLKLYLAFTNFGNENHYFNYKKLLLSNLNCLGIDEIRFHFGRLIRYCMLKSSNKKSAVFFEKELFDVYNFILENEYYKSSFSSFIPVELYRTILLLSLKMRKYKWAYEFIRKFKTKLPPDRRVNMYHYSCAEYYFSRGRYTDAMKSFKKVKFDHFMLKVDLKNLMLMTYYELSLFENAFMCIDAYKHFLSNDKTLSSIEKRKSNNFINAINILIKNRTSGNPGINKIGNVLQNELPFKDWIDEKISELEIKYNKSA